MGNIPIIPEWFFGYSISLELIFAITTLALAIYSFKIYKISGQRQTKLFGTAFSLISVSYFLQSVVTFAMLTKINEYISYVLMVVDVNTLDIIGLRLYMVFFIAGLTTLTYMTLKVNNSKIYSLMLIIAILAILFSSKVLYLFHLMSLVMFAYILFYYVMNYMKSKKKKTLLICVAFAFLLFGSLDFLFSASHGIYFVIGHALELVAYMLLLINLVTVLRK